MSAPASFKQADFSRVFKAAYEAGWGSVKIVIDPATQRIEAFASKAEQIPVADDWSDDE